MTSIEIKLNRQFLLIIESIQMSENQTMNMVSTFVMSILSGDSPVKMVKVNGKLRALRNQRGKSHIQRHLETLKSPEVDLQSGLLRFQQIVEHHELTCVPMSPKHILQLSNLKKVWMKYVFLIFLRAAQKELMNDQCTLEKVTLVKKKLAERYLGQLVGLKQSVEAGYFQIKGRRPPINISLSHTVFSLSDEVLYITLEQQAQKYQSKQSSSSAETRQDSIPEQKGTYNLMKPGISTCTIYSEQANKGYLLNDIAKLIDQVDLQYTNFQKDMRLLCGDKVSCNRKVKKVGDVAGLMRLFCKWTENLTKDNEKICKSKAFHNFFNNKKLAFNHFRMGAESSEGISFEPSINEKLLDLMAQLQVQSTFEGKQLSKDFGFYIYDLLRCKVEVNNMEKLKEILNNFEKAKQYSTKNSVQIFRIKNRLQTHNHDILVNFKYGPNLAAQIQIALKEHLDRKSKEKYTFKHFMYELVRNILGPTMELIILYQDSEGQQQKQADIMYPKGRVRRRNQMVSGIEVSKRCKCSVKEHDLYQVSKKALESEQTLVCSMCSNEVFSKNDKFCLYCHKCSFVYCLNCCGKRLEQQEVLNSDLRKIPLSTTDPTTDLMAGYKLVFLHFEHSPASRLMKIYLQTFAANKRVYMVDCKEEENNNDSILEQLRAERLPCFALYHNNRPLKKLIGASVFQLSLLISIVQKQQIQRNCPNNHPLEKLQPKPDFDWICCQCFRERQESNEPIYRCADCIYHVCSQCWFSDPEKFETYEDLHGRSYLSTAFRPNRHIVTKSDIAYRCSKDHLMKFTRTRPTISSKVRCFNCNSQNFFIRQQGAYYCSQCKESLCHRCCGRLEFLCDSNNQYANHPACQTVEQPPPCPTCHRFFKLTYSKSHNNRSSYCMRCLAKEQGNKLRLVCFYCQHFICHWCLNEYQAGSRREEIEGGLCGCSSDSVLEVLQMGEESAKRENFFQCADRCAHKYYMKTPHYRCKGCAKRYCRDCTKLMEDRNRKSLSIVVVRQIKQPKGINVLRSQRLEQTFPNTYTLAQVSTTIRQRLKISTSPTQGVFVSLEQPTSQCSSQQQSFISKDLDMNQPVGKFQTHSVTLHYFQSVEVLEDYLHNLGFRKRFSEMSNRRRRSSYLSVSENPERQGKEDSEACMGEVIQQENSPRSSPDITPNESNQITAEFAVRDRKFTNLF